MAADFAIIFQFRKDLTGQLFAQFNTPLVKAVDVPDNTLYKYFVLLHRYHRTQAMRGDFFKQERVGWAVTFKYFERRYFRYFCFRFTGCF